MAVRRDALDDLVSRCIRAAANCCQAHGEPYVNGGEELTRCHEMLQCCHIIGRSRGSLRCEPLNLLSMCATHHAWYTVHPAEFGAFLDRIAPGRRDHLTRLLVERKHFQPKKHKPDMRAHFREELKRIEAARMNGVTGPLEVASWPGY